MGEGVLKYLKMLKGYADVEMLTLKDESGVLKAVGESFCIVLDELGEEFSSVEFGQWIGKRKDVGDHLVFVIGGAYGLPEEVKARADLLLSLSKMTFTHQMVRIFLLEQIYRGLSIVYGKEYHN